MADSDDDWAGGDSPPTTLGGMSPADVEALFELQSRQFIPDDLDLHDT